MARYINNLPTQLPADRVYQMVEQIMRSEGFDYTEYKGEMVWKKGVGLLTAPQFISVVHHDNTITVQAWLKNVILPGVYVGEMGLKGFYGAALKAVLKKRVNKLELAMATENQNQMMGMQQGSY